MSVDEVKAVLRQEMDNRGWRTNDYRAGLAAIIGGESGFIPKFEIGWSHSSNTNIRRYFSSRVEGMTDVEIDHLKASDERFFNHVYGSQFEIGRSLGNTEPNDGYRYRGGGLIQLTGRANYRVYGAKVGVDLVTHPELIITPRVSAAVAVEYMKDRFRGGAFDQMKAAVGLSIGGPDDTKNQLYAEYSHTGEWDYQPGGNTPVTPVVPTGPVYDPVVLRFLGSLQELERFLAGRRLYSGPIDHDPGPGVRAGLAAYLRSVR